MSKWASTHVWWWERRCVNTDDDEACCRDGFNATCCCSSFNTPFILFHTNTATSSLGPVLQFTLKPPSSLHCPLYLELALPLPLEEQAAVFRSGCVPQLTVQSPIRGIVSERPSGVAQSGAPLISCYVASFSLFRTQAAAVAVVAMSMSGKRKAVRAPRPHYCYCYYCYCPYYYCSATVPPNSSRPSHCPNSCTCISSTCQGWELKNYLSQIIYPLFCS